MRSMDKRGVNAMALATRWPGRPLAAEHLWFVAHRADLIDRPPDQRTAPGPMRAVAKAW